MRLAIESCIEWNARLSYLINPYLNGIGPKGPVCRKRSPPARAKS
jgi:hypothetical protein